jgi:hypothetical protein
MWRCGQFFVFVGIWLFWLLSVGYFVFSGEERMYWQVLL